MMERRRMSARNESLMGRSKEAGAFSSISSKIKVTRRIKMVASEYFVNLNRLLNSAT